MYFYCFLKAATLSLLLQRISSRNNSALAVDKNAVPEPTFEGMVLRFKKGLNHFTDCSVDTLLKNCNLETTKNFECFRTLGECISTSVRVALKSEERQEQGPEPAQENDEL